MPTKFKNKSNKTHTPGEVTVINVPFKTPLDYFLQALEGKPKNINKFPEIQKQNKEWQSFDNDLHVYPYVHALPGILSMGCKNTCAFCPSAKYYKGQVHFGTPEIILSHYENKCVHFMDENFFLNDMERVLPALEKYNIKWLAMSTNDDWLKIYNQYGGKRLCNAGLRCVEVGLENVVLMNKVKKGQVKDDKIETYYLNMTFLPGETKETILENAVWMLDKGLRHPIHFNNGVWYAPGQFYYPYENDLPLGLMLSPPVARTRPTFIPDSFLDQDYQVQDLERVNYFNQFVYDFKLFPQEDEMHGLIREFISLSWKRTMWLVVGLRCGGIV